MKTIKEQIQEIDKLNIINFAENKIEYKGDFVTTTKIREANPEEYVRAYWVAKICNDEGVNPVRIEFEKKYSIGHDNNKKAFADLVVYKDGSDKNIKYILEFKKESSPELSDSSKIIKNQLYSLAYQETGVGKTIDYIGLLSTPWEKQIVIDFSVFNNYEIFEKLGKFTNWNSKDSSQIIKNKTNVIIMPEEIDKLSRLLKERLWAGSGSDTLIFNNLVKLLLAKIYDEKTTKNGEAYRFQIRPEENEIGLINRVNKLYSKARRQYFGDTSTSEINADEFGKEKITAAIKILQNIDFSAVIKETNKDIFGEFFEYILANGYKQTKGQYFTDASVVDFITSHMDPIKVVKNAFAEDRIPRIADTSAGSATFLISIMKQITKGMGSVNLSEFNDMQQEKINKIFELNTGGSNSWASQVLFGFDVDINLIETSKINMILHGDGVSNIHQVKSSLEKFNIKDKSFLDNKNAFDMVISNPPYLKASAIVKKALAETGIFGDKYENLEDYFVARFATIIREGGRLGVVLPASIFEGMKKQKVRENLFKNFKIHSLLELPQTTFEPYTKTRTYIMFAERTKKGHSGTINGFKIQDIGYKKYGFRNNKKTTSELLNITTEEIWND